MIGHHPGQPETHGSGLELPYILALWRYGIMGLQGPSALWRYGVMGVLDPLRYGVTA